MADLFVSYSRKNIAFARQLFSGLENTGLDIWIDWEDIPPGTEWLENIYQAIEEADNFVFVICKASIQSETCSKELEHARQNNKRLIPLVIDDVEADTIPDYLQALNWIFFRPQDDFEASMNLLLDAINLDQVHAKAHTNYQMRALSWERSDKEAGSFLRGTDLQEAEAWLAAAYEKDPPPTYLQQEYLTASRSFQVQRQRRTFAIMGGAFLAMLLLSIFAFIQRGIAREQSVAQATAERIAVEESHLQATAEAAALSDMYARATSQSESQTQRDIAYSQQLAMQAEGLDPGQMDLHLLLAAEAVDFSNTTAARNSLLNALTQQPNLHCFLGTEADSHVQSIKFSTGGDMLAVGNEQGTIKVFDPTTCGILAELQTGNDSAIEQFFFSRDDTILAAVDFQDKLYLWDLGTFEPKLEALDTGDLWKNLLAISPDGSSLVVQLRDGSINIVDSLTGDVQLVLEESSVLYPVAAYSPDGRELAVLDGGAIIVYWDLETGFPLDSSFTIQEAEEAKKPYRHELNQSYAITYNEAGTQLAFVSGRGTYLLDREKGTWYKTGDAYDVGFNSSGEAVAFGDYIFQIMEWDLRSGDSIGGPIYSNVVTGDLQGFTWNPKKGFYLQVNEWGESGSRYVLYSFNHPYSISSTIQHDREVYTSVFAQLNNRPTLITGGCAEGTRFNCYQGEILFWDPYTLERIGEPIPAHDNRITDLAIHPSDTLLVSTGPDNQILFWELPAGNKLDAPIRIEGSNRIDNILFNSNGSLFAVVTSEENRSSCLSVWDTENWESVLDCASLQADEPSSNIIDISFHPEYGCLISLQSDDTLVQWDLTIPGSATPELLTQLEGTHTTLDFSPLGDLIGIGSNGGITLVEFPSGDVLAYPQGDALHEELTRSVIYDLDGSLLAAHMGGNDVQLFDGRTGTEIGPPLPGRSDVAEWDPIHTLTFSPDSTTLASTNDEGEIILWDVNVDIWISTACLMANRSLSEIEWRRYLTDLPYDPVCSSIP
ncbi:MAG: toll/interleukin-1 receptor domain-containing protein [Anaerolineales bacterium]|nr:toll/interleukin-1 receptor domain-containing protein [Anaerolineales bacterium]